METPQTGHSLIHLPYFLIISLGNKQKFLATFYLLIFLSRTLLLLCVPRPQAMSCSCTRYQILFTLIVISKSADKNMYKIKYSFKNWFFGNSQTFSCMFVLALLKPLCVSWMFILKSPFQGLAVSSWRRLFTHFVS